MYVVKDTHEHAQLTPEGRFLVAAGTDGLLEYQPYEVLEVCDVCEEPPTGDDPLGHFKAPLEVCDACAADPAFQRAREAFGGALVGHCGHAMLGVYVIAHGQCGLDQELELA